MKRLFILLGHFLLVFVFIVCLGCSSSSTTGDDDDNDAATNNFPQAEIEN